MLRVICEVHYSNPEGASDGREMKTFDILAPEVEAFLRQHWPTNPDFPAWKAVTVRGVEVLQGRAE